MAEAATAEKFEEVIEAPFVRRFQSSDLSKHGKWFFPRLLKLMPHMTEARLHGWLYEMMGQNDFMFLYQDHGVALAMLRSEPLKPQALIEEVFVWMEDPAQESQQRDGAHFYTHFNEWARRKSISTLVVDVNSDIQRAVVLKVTGKRVFETKQSFMRVRED